MMSSQGVGLLRKNYSSSQVGVEDVEEPQYLHLKKLSEFSISIALPLSSIVTEMGKGHVRLSELPGAAAEPSGRKF